MELNFISVGSEYALPNSLQKIEMVLEIQKKVLVLNVRSRRTSRSRQVSLVPLAGGSRQCLRIGHFSLGWL